MLKKSEFFLFIFVTLITLGFTFLTANSTFAAYPDGVISHWKLDEATPGAAFGNYEDSFNGNDGTGDINPTAASGKVNGAQEFNSTDTTQINVPADISFDWQSHESFSIEFWVKTDGIAPDTNQVIIGRDDAATDLHWWVGLNGGDGLISFVLRDITGAGTASLVGVGTIDPTNGSWHHVVAVRDESIDTNLIYVDGVLQGRAVFDYAAGFGSATAALNIGWLNLSSGFYFNGLIDEVALYDRALPLAEIQAHRDAGLLGQGIETLVLEPVADAGPDQIVFDEITLDGSLSNHPDGEIIIYQWQLNHSQNSAFNTTATGVSPIVLDLKKGFYDVTLIVEDDEGRTDTDHMLFSATGPKGDFDFDGNVDEYDLSVFNEYYGITEVQIGD